MYISWLTTFLINIINLLILFSLLVIAKCKLLLQRILKSAKLYAIMWIVSLYIYLKHDHISNYKDCYKRIEMYRNLIDKFSNAIYDFTGQRPNVSLSSYSAQCILFLSRAFLPLFWIMCEATPTYGCDSFTRRIFRCFDC